MSAWMIMCVVGAIVGLVLGANSPRMARGRTLRVCWQASFVSALALGAVFLDLQARRIVPQVTTPQHLTAAAIYLLFSVLGGVAAYYWRDLMRSVGMGDESAERPQFVLVACGALSGEYGYLSYSWLERGFTEAAYVSGGIAVVSALLWIWCCVGQAESLSAAVTRNVCAIAPGVCYAWCLNTMLAGDPEIGVMFFTLVPALAMFSVAEYLTLKVTAPKANTPV